MNLEIDPTVRLRMQSRNNSIVVDENPTQIK